MGKKKNDRVEYALRNPSYLRVANILGLKNLDSNNDVAAIEEYIRKNGDPFQNALDEANRVTEDIRNKSIDDLNNLTISFEETIKNMNTDFNDKYGSLAASNQTALDTLNNTLITNQNNYQDSLRGQEQRFTDLMISQQDNFNSQLGELQGYLDRAIAEQQRIQGLYDEQVRIAKNQANAFVPSANPSATNVAAGDDREELAVTTKKRKPESDLTLLSGVGTQSNPLAGLQIA